jgi:oligopeptide/dipeptide ABC transporter ATP-binding protein
LLEVAGVSKRFALGGGDVVHALDDVSLTVAAGETVGLVGESGCGKSTLARVIMRLHEPSAGSVRFAGDDIATAGRRQLRALRRDVAMIFQDPYASLNPRRTVHDIVAEPLRIHRLGSGRALDAKVAALLDRVGLNTEHARRYPHEFSGGQRQRIGVARALATAPKLVICDEPVSALDVSIQAQVLNLLRDLQAELGLTLVFIAHDLGVVRHVADRIAVMYLGRIVETAPTDELFAAPRHPYTEALLAAVPVPDPSLARARLAAPPAVEGEVPSPINPPGGCHFHPRCRFSTEICAGTVPVLGPVGGSVAACHHPLGLGVVAT